MDDGSRVIPQSPPQTPDESTLRQLFPEVRPFPHAGTFELGLVLGGTVSAGAYTAGALDFLVQALDAWHERKDPPHKVLLSVAGGSSGGAVCASILGLIANRAPVAPKAVPAVDLFWKVWIDTFSFDKLVNCGDLKGKKLDEETGNQNDNTQTVPSALNSTMIDDAEKLVLEYATQPPTVERQWIAQPFSVAITVGNMRGIPYLVGTVHPPSGFSGGTFVQHDDYAWFAVPTWLNKPSGLVPKPYEFWVEDDGFGKMAQWAGASGAMPVGLKARILERPLIHYVYRPNVRVVRESDNKPFVSVYEQPVPDWDSLPEAKEGQPYKFTAVDGGTFNNDPVRLVHMALAGTVGRNPTGPQEACRAMLMIDPLDDQASVSKKVGWSMIAIAKVMIGTFVSAARYLTADLDLFARDDIFSRFQLVPNRIRPDNGKQLLGEDALAGTGLGALAGWCAPKFREHDFFLGRSNMKDYLSSKFILNGKNSLFNGWSTNDRIKYAKKPDGSPWNGPLPKDPSQYFLPVIPAADDLTTPDAIWPVNELDPDKIKAPLKDRLEAVLKHVREDDLPGFFDWLVALAAAPSIADSLASSLIADFKKQLQKVGLWTK